MKQLLTLLILIFPLMSWGQTNLTADIEYLSIESSGQYQDYLATGQSNYLAPVLILEINDIDNTKGFVETQSHFNQQNLFNQLKNDGFDITILVFDDFTTYIQRNAFLVVKMLNILKGRTEVPITIIASGASGMMAHYAVRYMEDNSISHNVERIITIDTPFNGWQYPLGAQLYLDDIAQSGQFPVWQDLTDFRDFQDSPLNKQLSIYHGSNTRITGNLSPHPNITSFYNDFGTTFTTSTRNIGISNGSNQNVNSSHGKRQTNRWGNEVTGTMALATPAVTWDLDHTSLKDEGFYYLYAPSYYPTTYFSRKANNGIVKSFTKGSTHNDKNYETIPGSYSTFNKDVMYDSFAAKTGTSNYEFDKTAIVSTFSGLAMTMDYQARVSAPFYTHGSNSPDSQIPLTEYYIESTNKAFETITAGAKNFIMNEIHNNGKVKMYKGVNVSSGTKEQNRDIVFRNITAGGGTITIPSSSRLFVEGTVSFPSGGAITSNGKVIAANASFVKTGSSKFSFIYLNSGASGSTFKNVTVSGTNYGIHTNGAHSLVFDNVTSTQSKYSGVKLVNSSATFYGGTYDNNDATADGVMVFNGSYASFFSGPMSFKNNGYYGVRVGYSSSAEFGTSNTHAFPLESAFADIRGNKWGVGSYQYSNVYMGDVNDTQPWYIYHRGWNQIKDNTQYDLVVTTNGYVLGEDNYWGTTDYATIQSKILHTGGSYDILPVASSYAFKNVSKNNSEQNFLSKRNSKEVAFSDSVKSFLAANDIDGLKQWVSTRKDSDDIQRTLRLDLLRIQLGDADQVFPKYAAGLHGVGRTKNQDVPFEIQEQYFHYLLEQGKLNQAAKMYANFPEPVDRTEDRTIYPTLLEMHGYNGDVSASHEPQVQENVNAITSMQASPNPFNPTTAIDLELSTSAKVQMEVYNVLGQRVAVLNNASLQAGSHRFSFDASRLASGLYFVQTIVDGAPLAPLKLSLIK